MKLSAKTCRCHKKSGRLEANVRHLGVIHRSQAVIPRLEAHADDIFPSTGTCNQCYEQKQTNKNIPFFVFLSHHVIDTKFYFLLTRPHWTESDLSIICLWLPRPPSGRSVRFSSAWLMWLWQCADHKLSKLSLPK